MQLKLMNHYSKIWMIWSYRTMMKMMKTTYQDRAATVINKRSRAKLSARIPSMALKYCVLYFGICHATADKYVLVPNVTCTKT